MWFLLLVRLNLHGSDRDETARQFQLEDKYFGPDDTHIYKLLNPFGIDTFNKLKVDSEHITISVWDDLPTICLVEQTLQEHIRDVQKQLVTFQNQNELQLGTLKLSANIRVASLDPMERIRINIFKKLIPESRTRPCFNDPYAVLEADINLTNIVRDFQ